MTPADPPTPAAPPAATDPPPPAAVVVVTGPSGVGKGTLIQGLRTRLPELALSVSATTRRPRRGERSGADYHFLSRLEFERRVQAGEFLEHAAYSGNRYGTLRSEVQARRDAGTPVILEIEVEGARQVREALPDAIEVFIAPPSFEELRARLLARGTDSEEDVDRRLDVARHEMGASGEFPAIIVNDTFEHALDALYAIVVRAVRPGG